MAGDGFELPIFELPVAILPGELIPLHIFEERYKRMIGHCLDEGEPFGIVLSDDEGGARNVGCSAHVTEVLERFDDGRMNVVVTGGEPFAVLDRFEAPEFPAGQVQPLEHSDEGEEEDAEAAESARGAFAELAERVSGEAPDAGELAAKDAYGIAARVELPSETKQRLLELRSEPERMRLLDNALRALLSTLERAHEIAERARMNGKVVIR
jgi:Lon protease-like protein